jgi:hypothetical protein
MIVAAAKVSAMSVEPLWIGSAIGAVLIVVLLSRQAMRRWKHRHPAE